MAVTLLRISAGASRFVVVPSPTCPKALFPQAQRLPLESSASECSPWVEMATTLLRPDTCTGVLRGVVVPSPSWPKELSPQAQTVPLEPRASEW